MITEKLPPDADNRFGVNLEKTPFGAAAPLALVIGCGDLGMATARALGRRHPLLIVDIDSDRLHMSIAALRGEGYVASCQVCDITDAHAVDRLADSLPRGCGVHVLAHVAAIADTPGGWRAVMKVNLLAPHLTSRAIGPHIVRGGVAVFVSSAGAYHCPRDPRLEALIDDPFVANFEEKFVEAYGREPDFMHAYFISKQGVNRLTQRVAIEWGPRQVRAVSVSPGQIDSTMGRTSGALLPVWDGGEYRRVTRSEKAKIEIPLQREATLFEIASVIDFLASDRATFLSGIDIPVDGGATAFWRNRRVIER